MSISGKLILFQVDFQRLSEWVSLDSIDDYRDLANRLILGKGSVIIFRYYAFGDYMSELIEMLGRGIKEGQTNHNVSMAGVLDQVSLSYTSMIKMGIL